MVLGAGLKKADVGAVHVVREKMAAPPGAPPPPPGPSRGYGFVEFSSHAAALAAASPGGEPNHGCLQDTSRREERAVETPSGDNSGPTQALRHANNNPSLSSYCLPKGRKPGARPPRPIVAFAVENVQKAQLKQKKKDDARAKNAERLAAAGGDADAVGPDRKARRTARRIENRLEKKRRRREEAPAPAPAAAAPPPPAPRPAVEDDDAAVDALLAADAAPTKKKRRKKVPALKGQPDVVDAHHFARRRQDEAAASLADSVKAALADGGSRWFD